MRRRILPREKSEIMKILRDPSCVIPHLARKYLISRSVLYRWRRELKLAASAGKDVAVEKGSEDDLNKSMNFDKNPNLYSNKKPASIPLVTSDNKTYRKDKSLNNHGRFVELSVTDEDQNNELDLMIEEANLRFDNFTLNLAGQIESMMLMKLLATLNERSGARKC